MIFRRLILIDHYLLAEFQIQDIISLNHLQILILCNTLNKKFELYVFFPKKLIFDYNT